MIFTNAKGQKIQFHATCVMLTLTTLCLEPLLTRAVMGIGWFTVVQELLVTGIP